MFDMNGNYGKGGGMKGLSFISTLVAIFATFMGTGPFYTATKLFIYNYAFDQYGGTFASAAVFLWGGLCALLVFGVVKTVFSLLVKYLMVIVMTRLH